MQKQYAYGATFENGVLTIPKGVTVIESRTIWGSEITAIILPSTLKEIKMNGIRCENLKAINLPNGIERIEPYGLSGCKSLERIYVSDTFTRIDEFKHRFSSKQKFVQYPASQIHGKDSVMKNEGRNGK